MATVTSRLAKKMARAKKINSQAVQGLKALGKDADQRHDEVAAKIAGVEKKLEASPNDEKLLAELDALMEVKRGLLAASEFSSNTAKLHA